MVITTDGAVESETTSSFLAGGSRAEHWDAASGRKVSNYLQRFIEELRFLTWTSCPRVGGEAPIATRLGNTELSVFPLDRVHLIEVLCHNMPGLDKEASSAYVQATEIIF